MSGQGPQNRGTRVASDPQMQETLSAHRELFGAREADALGKLLVWVYAGQNGGQLPPRDVFWWSCWHRDQRERRWRERRDRDDPGKNARKLAVALADAPADLPAPPERGGVRFDDGSGGFWAGVGVDLGPIWALGLEEVHICQGYDPTTGEACSQMLTGPGICVPCDLALEGAQAGGGDDAIGDAA